MRRIIKRVGNKTIVINIPTINGYDISISSAGYPEKVTEEIFIPLFRVTENNIIRTTENGLERMIE